MMTLLWYDTSFVHVYFFNNQNKFFFFFSFSTDKNTQVNNVYISSQRPLLLNILLVRHPPLTFKHPPSFHVIRLTCQASLCSVDQVKIKGFMIHPSFGLFLISSGQWLNWSHTHVLLIFFFHWVPGVCSRRRFLFSQFSPLFSFLTHFTSLAILLFLWQAGAEDVLFIPNGYGVHEPDSAYIINKGPIRFSLFILVGTFLVILSFGLVFSLFSFRQPIFSSFLISFFLYFRALATFKPSSVPHFSSFTLIMATSNFLFFDLSSLF